MKKLLLALLGALLAVGSAVASYDPGVRASVPSLVYNSAAAAAVNTAAINAALALGGHVLIECVPSGGVIYTSGHLTVYSNTNLEIRPGCVVRQAPGTNDTMIVNAAYKAAWSTVWDSSGSITTGPLNLFQLPSGWAASHVYAQGSEVTVNNGIYWASASTCTSAGSGGPSGTGTAIADGTCSWNYVTAPTPTNASSLYTSSTRQTYYALVHYPSHGLTVGSFLFVTPQPDSGNLWTGTGSAGQLGGPDDSAYFGVFYVAAVNDANWLTVELRRQPTIASSGIPLQLKAADDNIQITGGGTLDYQYTSNPTGATQREEDTFYLAGIHNLIVDNLNCINGHRYCLLVNGVYGLDVGHVQGGPLWTQSPGVNGDQVHVYGPAFDVLVHDINGSGYDDTVIFSTSENTGANSAQIVASGDVYKATARNVSGYSGERLGLFQSQGAGLLRMQGVLLDNIETYMTRVNNLPSILIGGSGAFNDITVENSTVKNAGYPFMQVLAGTGGVGITMDSLKFLNDDVRESNSSFLTLANAAGAPVVINDISMSHIVYSAGTAAFIAPTVSAGTALTVKNLNISDVNYASNQNLVLVQTGSTFNHVVIDDSVFVTTASLINNNNAGGGDFTFSHNYLSGGGYVLYQTSANTTASVLRLSGNDLTGAGYALPYQAGSFGVSLYSDGGNTLSGGFGWISYQTGISTTVKGWDIQCDVTKMARVTGSYCYNTNTAPGSGTLTTAGLVADTGTAANSWALLTNPSGQQY